MDRYGRSIKMISFVISALISGSIVLSSYHSFSTAASSFDAYEVPLLYEPDIDEADDHIQLITVPTRIHNLYGGFNEITLGYLIKNDEFFISLDCAESLGLMDSDSITDTDSIIFKRTVKSLVNETVLGTVEKKYEGEIVEYPVNHVSTRFVNLDELCDLLDISCSYDGYSFVVFPRSFYDDEFVMLMDDLFESPALGVDSVMDDDSLALARLYRSFRNSSFIDAITGRQYYDDYLSVLIGMMNEDETVSSKSKDIKESENAIKWLNFGLTSFSYFVPNPVSFKYDQSGNFIGYSDDIQSDDFRKMDIKSWMFNYMGFTEEQSWINDIADNAEITLNEYNNITSRIASYQNARKINYWYADALYYGIIKPGGYEDDISDPYVEDSSYMSDAAGDIYYQMDGFIPGIFADEAESYIYSYLDKSIDKMISDSFTNNYKAHKLIISQLSELIGADQEINHGVNTAICDSICDRCKNAYQNYRYVNYEGMLYSALMYLRATSYYCDMYDDNATMIASISGWTEADSAYFRNNKKIAQDVMAKLVALDNYSKSFSGLGGYEFYVYDANGDMCGDEDDPTRWVTDAPPVGIVITGYTGNSTRITIPDRICNLPVREISQFAFTDSSDYYSRCPNADYIKSIRIPGSVRKIGVDAFFGAKSLESVFIENGIEEIEGGAFEHNFSLKNIEIPDSVTRIGASAFCYDSSLEYVDLPDSIQELGPNAFCFCESLKEIRIPGSLKVIEEETFSDCDNLTSVYIEDGVTTLNGNVFFGCSALEEIRVPETLTTLNECGTIPYGNFGSCYSLTQIDLPGVTKLGYSEFSACVSLESVSIPKATEIGRYSFSDCTSLEKVNMPLIKEIPEGAFEYCEALDSFDYSKITSIGACSFRGCKSLDNIDLCNVDSIPYHAFADCENLKTVKCDSVKTIGEEAFAGCKALSSLKIDNVASIDFLAFKDTGIEKLSLPKVTWIDVYNLSGRTLTLPGTPPELSISSHYYYYDYTLDEYLAKKVNNLLIRIPCYAYDDYIGSDWGKIHGLKIILVHDYNNKDVCKDCNVKKGDEVIINIDDKPSPSVNPTQKPSVKPSNKPSNKPTELPSDKPTNKPSTTPTNTPSAKPSNASETGTSGFIDRLYQNILGRNADAAGKADWMNQIMTKGKTGADIAKGFLYSQEFLNKDMSNGEFLEILYKVFFDRASDEGGKAHWLRLMSGGMSKQDVIMGFINSTEWANVCLTYGIPSGGTGIPNKNIEPNEKVIAFATRLYTTCLERNVDEGGLKYWSTELANMRVSGTKAAWGFFFSDEMINKNLPSDIYITRLYRTFMGREPDQGGFDYWMGRFASGATREEVFYGFANAPEFAKICADYGIVK